MKCDSWFLPPSLLVEPTLYMSIHPAPGYHPLQPPLQHLASKSRRSHGFVGLQ